MKKRDFRKKFVKVCAVFLLFALFIALTPVCHVHAEEEKEENQTETALPENESDAAVTEEASDEPPAEEDGEQSGTDALAEVTALLEGIDSLADMQAARGRFAVSAMYDASDAAIVAEHQAAREGYEAYLADMFAARAAAREAYEALTPEEQAQIDPTLVKKLTDGLETIFNGGTYPLTPSSNEYNYQILQISSRYYLAYELSQHASIDRDMPCTLILADVSGDAESITLDGPYSYGTNNYLLTYCCDELQPTSFGVHYKRVNLEDSTYYNSFQADKLRAIILNSYPFISLEDMKAQLTSNGFLSAEELDRADIIAAVQFAVWYYSNRMTNMQLSDDTTYGWTFDAISYRAGGSKPLISSVHDYRNELWYWWNSANPRFWSYDEAAEQRVTKLFNYLIALPGVSAGEAQQIITVVAIERTGMQQNADGSCTADLRIRLNHGAGSGDQVTIQVETAAGVSTFAADSRDQYETSVTVWPGETVQVTVSGTQYLAKGVYFYEPEGGYSASQALIGVAEGETIVRAEKSFTVERDIETGLRIYKTVEETGWPLEDIPFSVYRIPASEADDVSGTPTAEEIAKYAVAANLAGTVRTDASGYASISLEEGTYLLIEEEISAVKSPAAPLYFTLPFAVEQQNEAGEIEIVYQNIAELYIKNRPEDERGTVSVYPELTKEINDWGQAESFSFILTAVTPGAPMPEKNRAVASKDAPKAEFGKILFSEEGIYEYTITEVNDGLTGITYDETPHRLIVTVTKHITADAGDESLIDTYELLAEVTYDGEESLTITNRYTPPQPQPARVVLSGRKEISGEPEEQVTFSFKLRETTEGADYEETVSVTGAGEFSFQPLLFDRSGVYTYEITETAGDAAGWTYDSRSYAVTITVLEKEDGSLSAEVEGLPEGTAGFVFTNQYTPPAPPMGDSRDLLYPVILLTAAVLALILAAKRLKFRKIKA